ncbi:alpha-amylase family glycosyl hydrolase [Reinekea blandensis]|uniref:Putative alpha amylase n=1 Tax=Reinekea blandensis MED297 TaxID=314283 RepID=A4B908_9GAMM|nr:alpha-amylase family glycosyl hydrolase [Reinekea blandensis]EAR11109.1 putative alpha amylase [Reinekea sp. MED297] [Reinekea blandensis MED297]
MTFTARKLALAMVTASAIILSGCLPEVPYQDRDVRDDVFYFVMPDRFENGDLSNDYGGIAGGAYEHGFDPYDKGMYHGGDMAGLESRLDYLKELGVTAIWMTPILKNQAVQGSPTEFSSAYHGYWTLDFTQIDPHLGSNDDLKSLIDAAHDRNMKVFFDIITNHTADVIKYEECHEPDGTAIVNPCPYVSLAEKAEGNGLTPFVPVGNENLKVPAWLNDPQYYNNQGDSTFSGENSIYGDFVGLDDLDTTQPEVIDGMIDIFEDLVSEFKPDGFRIDTVKHVNIEFWQAFSPALLEHARAEGIPNFFMFGEVYDGNPQFLSQFTTIGKLPSVLDFGIQGAASSVFANNGSSTALSGLFAQDDVYSDTDSDASTLMNFGGNHDMGRLGMFIQNGNPNASDDELLARAKLFNAFMFFARGIPVIYYGDEQGFTGDGGDQDAREDMFPSQVSSYNDNRLIGTSATTAEDNFDTGHPLYLAIRDYADVYKSHATLRYGAHVNRYSEDGGLYAFSRIGDDRREYLIVFNSEPQARELTLSASAPIYLPVIADDKLKATSSGDITLVVEPFDFAIYRAARPTPFSPKTDFEITGVENGAAVAGRVDIELALAKPASALSTYEATFEVSTDDGLTWAPVASDRTAPYRLFWQSGELADGTDVLLRARLDNGQGKTSQQQVSLVIDSRVPDRVTVDYENGNDRTTLYVSDEDGGLQGPIFADDGLFEFRWDEDDDRQVLVFVDQQGDTFAIDRPVSISRSTIVAQSEDNAEGDLEAFVYLNNNGDLANNDNDVGGVPVELPLQADAPAPLGNDVNLRGGLNSWGTDAMTYVGNQTYKVQRLIDAGDVEFKFADSTWSALNIGGPVTDTGLTQGANPGNLTHTFTQTALYNLYLVSTELDGESFLLHFMNPEVGPVGETVYLKGDMNDWSEQTAMVYLGEQRYQVEVPLEPGDYSFKLANADWSWERTANGPIPLDSTVSVSASGGNSTLSATEAANYTFSYQFDDESLTISSDFVPEDDPGMRVVFRLPDDWVAPANIYFWEAATTETPAWPGLVMDDLGDGWYGFQFNDGTASANVIFNDGGNQTANLSRDRDGCYVDANWQDSCPPYLGDEPGVDALSLRFEAPEDWTEVSVYYWNTAPESVTVDWPGETATPLYGNWWSIELPAGVAAANVIFNNGGAGAQTTDLFRDADGCYRYAEQRWSDSCIVSMSVSVRKPAEWTDDLNVYYWNAAVPGPAWPGEPMTPSDGDVYQFDFPDGVFSANLIFNDGVSEQTADLYRESDGCYDVALQTWTATCSP